MGHSIIRDKSYMFAVEVIRSYQELKKSSRDIDLFRQFLRAGTSIGANVEEAVAAQSRKDFLSKLYISYKEARETLYWIRLLTDTNYLNADKSEHLMKLCDELVRILSSITKTTSESLKK